MERWVGQTLRSYSPEMLPFLSGELDPFRNPVGYTLRTNLAALAHELLGDMDKGRITEAMDALVRVRAVQNFSPADAVRFVFELRLAIHETTGSVSQSLDGRIDELALIAFEQYMRCREQLFDLRLNELRSRVHYVAAGREVTE